MEKTIRQLICRLCGYRWFPRAQGLPKACPKCKQYNWQKKPEKNNGGNTMKMTIAVLLGILAVAPLMSAELPTARVAHKEALEVRTGALMDKIAEAVLRASKEGKYETAVSYKGYKESVAMEVIGLLYKKGYYSDGYFPKTLWVKWN